MDWELHSGGNVRILCCDRTQAVCIAACNLVKDIEKVFSGNIHVDLENCTDDEYSIKIQNNSNSCINSENYNNDENIADTEECRTPSDDTQDISCIVIRRRELGKKEAYSHLVQDGVLYISGQDRRGVIYGIYELSRWLGVSPWYYFADVPVKKRDKAVLPDGYSYDDYPSVEYRGIFINDEEELDKWVRLHLGEETIGVKAYEKIFELLLRLRANYIWPAMHVNSFNVKRDNGELADMMGIVVGTSHCDMLMRSNNREWYPWLKKKGYTDVEYDYSIPGKNRDVLDEYWRESVEQNKDFEVGYTLGMRGIHDSGFETKSLEGLEGEALRNAKIELLQTIINAQEKILSDTLDKEPLKSFVPYKEVLELYDNGLEVPEDLTLIWTNDNYGYIRRYPGEKEKKRKGGNGIYYHNSYWAAPGMSYLFINSIPLAHTRNELYKAWCEGIRKVWVLNVGAIKPLEQEISFYLNFAWEVGKDNPPRRTDDVDEYLKLWINETFSGQHGEKLAGILNDFSQLTNVRKIELMDSDVFSQTAYGDEAAARINRYAKLVREADKVYEALQADEKDAFFQMCLMKIHAAYYTNCMFYYADRSYLCTKQGKCQAAYKYAGLSRQYDDKRRRLISYYNTIMAGGKWSGILTPEDFPPPRTAMLPACVVPLTPLEETEKRLVVTVWNDENSINFVSDRQKWFELANAGEGELNVNVELPKWLDIVGGAAHKNGGNHTYKAEFSVGAESRIMVQPAHKPEIINRCFDSEEDLLNAEQAYYSGIESGKALVTGKIRIVCDETRQSVEIPVSVDFGKMKLSHERGVIVEDGNVVSLEADSIPPEAVGTGWHVVKRLGRDHGAVIEAVADCKMNDDTQRCADKDNHADNRTGKNDESTGVKFNFYINEAVTAPMLEVHRFPSLNSTGRIRAEVSVDGGERLLVESKSNDEWRGTWKQNIFDNVDKLMLALPELERGERTIEIFPVDKYFAFSRIVIYTKDRKDSMLGGLLWDDSLPCPAMSRQCDNICDSDNTVHDAVHASCYDVGEELYGSLKLAQRPMLVAGVTPGSNTLPDTNTPIEWDYKTGQASYRITAKQIIAMADTPFAEKNGVIKLDMASGLADNDNAYMKGMWEYCLSESYNRTGLAMYIRKPGLKFDDMKPSLHYRILCDGGIYSMWLLMKNESYDGAELLADIDGKVLERSELSGGERIGNYCGERVYRWVKLWKQELAAGVHEIGIYTPSSANRFDRIYITKGEEYPLNDSDWIEEE